MKQPKKPIITDICTFSNDNKEFSFRVIDNNNFELKIRKDKEILKKENLTVEEIDLGDLSSSVSWIDNSKVLLVFGESTRDSVSLNHTQSYLRIDVAASIFFEFSIDSGVKFFAKGKTPLAVESNLFSGSVSILDQLNFLNYKEISPIKERFLKNFKVCNKLILRRGKDDKLIVNNEEFPLETLIIDESSRKISLSKKPVVEVGGKKTRLDKEIQSIYTKKKALIFETKDDYVICLNKYKRVKFKADYFWISANSSKDNDLFFVRNNDLIKLSIDSLEIEKIRRLPDFDKINELKEVNRSKLDFKFLLNSKFYKRIDNSLIINDRTIIPLKEDTPCILVSFFGIISSFRDKVYFMNQRDYSENMFSMLLRSLLDEAVGIKTFKNITCLTFKISKNCHLISSRGKPELIETNQSIEKILMKKKSRVI